ncbi:MAG: hypothetical protein FJW96_04210 [Actinobacteria bacterium]|nr:hypothetical protein [Actinomycetota bacterium]
MHSTTTTATCDDCYFRREGLCALPGNAICPTFRAATKKGLVPPRQAPLILRPPAQLTAAAT